jgi:hypothetical protein
VTLCRVRAAGIVRVAAVIVIAVATAACAGPVESAVPGAASSEAIASPDPSSVATASAIVVDEGLLDVLPAQVAGIDLVGDPDTAAAIASDPDLAATASAIAVAFAIAPGDSGSEDLAVISVVQLRPGVFDDAFYRSWRDTYDAAACAPAGGVTGNAQAEIGGHESYIGTCGQGAFTYHVYLEDLDRFVSITSVGERRLGEQVVAGIRE